MRTRKLHYAWLILVGIIIIRGFSGGGINLTSGLFLAPVSEELNIGIGSLSLYFSITSIVMVLWLPICGKLMNTYDIRIMAVIGVFLQALSFLAFGFMNTVWGWYLLAIPHAMGATILVNLLGPILIHRWFMKDTGLILGIQMAFVSLFGTILQPYTSQLIAQSGWRMGYYVIGGSTFIVVLLASLLLLRNKPADLHLHPYGEDNILQQSNRNQAPSNSDHTEKKVNHTTSFYLLILFMIAITGVAVFVQHIPTYGHILGYSLQETGSALAFASIGSAIGSIAIGIVCDKLGCLQTCYGIITLGFFSIFGFFMSSNSFLIFILSTFFHGLLSASIMVLAPILILKFYGQNNYEKTFAQVSMGAPLASIIFIPLYGFIYDMMKNYNLVLLSMLLLLIVAFTSIHMSSNRNN